MTPPVDIAHERDVFEHFCAQHRAARASVLHNGRDFLVAKVAIHEHDVLILLLNATERVAIRFADPALPTLPAVHARVTLRAGLHLVPHAASKPVARHAPRSRFWSRLVGWLYRRSGTASRAHHRPRARCAHAES